MLKSLILFSFLIMLLPCSSQNIENNCDQMEKKKKIYEEHLIGKLYVNPYTGEDKQFVYPWLDGDVLLSNGYNITDMKLRYNGITDELIWIRKLDYQTVVVDKDKIKGFTLYNNDGSLKVRFEKIDIPYLHIEKNGNTFLEVLTEGKINLYAHRKIVYLKNRKEFFDDYSYYISKGNEIRQVNLNWRNLMKQLPERKKEIKSIIRSEHLNPKKEPGIIAIIESLNIH